MEGERRTRRKPLSDRTNSTTLPLNSSSSHAKLPPPSPHIANSTATTRQLVEPNSNKKTKKILVDTSETPKKRRRKFADPTLRSTNTDEGNKENVDTNIIFPVSPFTPSVRQPLSPLDEQLTVYARRSTDKTKEKEKEKVVVNEAFTYPPVGRKQDESGKASFLKVRKCLTDRPKKRRIKEHVVSKDYIDQQKAYFAEIDKCELLEEEVSESELSDH